MRKRRTRRKSTREEDEEGQHRAPHTKLKHFSGVRLELERARSARDGSSMYIHIYVYIHTYIHIYIHTYIHTYRSYIIVPIS